MATSNLLSRTTQRILTYRNISLTHRKHIGLWTADNIVKSPHKDVDIPNRTVPEHIWENMERWADKTALVCAITDRSYTYHQLYKYSRNFAAKLRTQLKIRDGDVICIMMPNSPEYALAALGALEAGAEVTTVNPIYTPYEVERQIKQSDPKILIGVPETIPVLKEALFLAKKDIPIITVKETDSDLPPKTISFQEFALADNVDHSVLKEVARNSTDVAFLPYSSGTTGLPKGVELTHRNIVVNCLQQDVDSVRHYVETTKTNQDVALAVLPFYHIYGQSVVMWHKLSVGYKIVTVPKFQPNTFMETLKNHKINLFCAAPPLILFLGSHPGIKEEHLASMKTITSGAAPLARNDVTKVLEKVKHNMDFLQIYGMTEASPLVSAMLPGSNDYSKAGNAVPNTELKIADKELRPLGPNEMGELFIRGPQVMKCYRNNPEATKAAISKDGWYGTGDLASIDENGIVTICDRLKELIKVKGYQVPPAELENVLKEHPDILDAAVLGIPDARTGEAPKAFVVLKDGRKLDANGVTSFVSERVAIYKRVKEVVFLDALPKNPSGKILKRVLKEKYYEVERQIKQSDPKIVIGVPETIPVLKEALFLAKKDIPIITVKETDSDLPPKTISFQEFALADNVDHSVLKEVARNSTDVAFLPYSSGTTGLPKGVELTHRNIVVNCLQQDVDSVRHYVETTKTNQDVALAVLPFYHIYGQSVVMWHKLSVGYKIVTVPKFQPNTFMETLKNHKINLFCAAPPLILFLGSHPGIKEEHLASMKTITSGAAPLARNDVTKVLEKVKHNMDFLQIYGMTEASPLVSAMLPGSNDYSKAGNAVPNTELKIADKELRPLGPNEMGELFIRGPQVMKCYRNNPEATKAAISKDGWYGTGDLASIDENGIVTICDRLKELIKVKGYQVPPAELENVLKEHPDILDAAVLGIPDARTGEAPKAFVVLKDGRKLDANGVTSFVSERVAIYKRVKEVVFLDALPKNPSGKILKRVLKEKYC